MKRAALLCICLFQVLLANSKNLYVDILSAASISSIDLSVVKGFYQVELDDNKILRFDGDDHLVMQVVGNKVSISKNERLVGIYNEVHVKTKDDNAFLKVKYNKGKINYYEDELLFRGLISKLQIINIVELNHYVAGVVESEIGNVRNHELLKVQAVISRTYALKHLERHKASQVQLCDQVHCQVYHGKSRFNDFIQHAVDSTNYEVIVDSKNALIEAVFHANCGGQTVNSEDVWSMKRSYLRSVVDTFCTKEKQAYWEKEIDKKDWLAYLSKKSGKDVIDACTFQIQQRINLMPCCSVRMEDLRIDFRLKSTFFNVDESPEKVLLHGRGFGHGVGMCQEGSINMANSGIPYKSIITFYYSNIQIVDYRDLE